MDSYKEVKNLIHNDFKITKDDIKEMILQTVKEETAKILNDESFLETMLQTEIKKVMRSEFKSPMWKRVFQLDTEIYSAVCDEVSKTVKERLEIKLKD